MSMLAEPVAASASPAAVPALLSLRGLSKRFGSLQALDDVSLEIAPAEIHALLGENGAGKSTLCNLVFGVYQPDSGTMSFDGAPYGPAGPAQALAQGIAMVHQHFSLVGDMTVVENLMLGQVGGLLRRNDYARSVDALSQEYGLALDPRARIADLSVGERQRVEIVKCLMRNPRLVVLDEPTAVLLPAEIGGLLAVCERIAAKGCSVVLVTHKLAEIRKVAHRATVLRGGRVVAHSTAPAREMVQLVRAMIQRDLDGLAAGAGAMLGAAAVASPEGAAHRPATPETPSPASDEALQVDGLSVVDAEGTRRLDNFTLIVNRGEIVGVAGVEGNGQSELAAALSGMVSAREGRFFVRGRDMSGATPKALSAAGVGVVPEDRHAVGCITGMSLAENLSLNRLDRFKRFGLLDRAALRRAALALMERFDVRAAGPDVAFGSLSGGNQQKAVLGREISTEGLVFLLAAQPTRGLDVGAVEAVYGQIRAACRDGAGVLLISSELDELIDVADRIIVLYRGRVMGHCPAEPAQRERIGAMMAGQAA